VNWGKVVGFRGTTTKEDGERGAALIEFAIILPLLLVLLFGIMEASWAFAQVNDVRHGAREGARLAAVDHGTAPTIYTAVCDRMDRSGGSTIAVNLTGITGSGERGDTARIEVDLTYSSLTGFLDPIFQGSVYSSNIQFRLEQPVDAIAQWWGQAAGSC
jgi:hypothetical protein